MVAEPKGHHRTSVNRRGPRLAKQTKAFLTGGIRKECEVRWSVGAAEEGSSCGHPGASGRIDVALIYLNAVLRTGRIERVLVRVGFMARLHRRRLEGCRDDGALSSRYVGQFDRAVSAMPGIST